MPASNADSRQQQRAAIKGSTKGPILINVSQLTDFDEIIDVRSEDEFAQDHIPGAINCPVLDNAQRAQVGTIYKTISSFDAKKTGAALVSANIARHLQEQFRECPPDWRPLVYCWRGGGRSGALAHVLYQIGWRVGRLDGGYKAYRRAVIADLDHLPSRFGWRVICGLTGSGKSRLLRALKARGGQVLDLEALAAHRGSVLGNLPDEPQPAQKMFESLIWNELRNFSAARCVYVEAESKKIGNLRVPETLIAAMWSGECVQLDAQLALRVKLLKEEYAHYIDRPQTLIAKLECLTGLYGHETINKWKRFTLAGQWDALTEDLLLRHYDPAYTRSTLKHYPNLPRAHKLELGDTGDAAFDALAGNCLAGHETVRTQ
ncbi:MAG: tRNA 2-selenouridine(34) synthase MnmH [Pseudomonadota bacterium]